MAKKTGKKLVIVESPAKARTINKYLGPDYVVKASMGHVRDLPTKGGMGVDLETFQPEYEVLPSRGKVIKELRALAKDSPEVYLATDLDREGEAIAWHLKEALNVPDDRARRVIFNAITRSEIQKAFQTPHEIDIDRVNAQQARRILDRIVGWEISPILWRKVARGLSAGRVQSVAVRLIVEREREIAAFIPAEFWKIAGVFSADGANAPRLADDWHQFLTSTGNGERTRAERDKWLERHGAFMAELVELGGSKFEAGNREDARRAAQLLGFALTREQASEDAEARGPARHLCQLIGRVGPDAPSFAVRSIEKKRITSRPAAPFITSTLQQAASSRLSFGAQRTMKIAQGLYEAGHITYMRTDSTHLSADALKMARSYIQDNFGDRYLPDSPNLYTSSNKSAQEAHEAIRPTDAAFTVQQAHAKLSQDEHKLYQLIWNRFIASQMTPAQFDQTTVNIEAAASAADPPAGLFRATGRKLVFDGFMRVMGVSSEDQLLPALDERQPVYPIQIDPSQHFTQAPPRYSEATLVKELERLGIGRPSTYAAIIQTIQDREYVTQINRRFHATLLGSVVTDKLIVAFPQIMDVKFTADMESKLDQIEEKHLDWVALLREFYGPFHQVVEGALGKIEHAGGTSSEYTCQECSSPMVYRISKNGFFLACTSRECSATRPVDQQGRPTVREVSEHRCPRCGREMIRRKGRFGEFLGCAGYSLKKEDGTPECGTIINLDKQGNPLPPKAKPIPTDIKCEKCGGMMVLRDGKRGPWLGCAAFPKCRAILGMGKMTPEQKAHIEPLIPALKAETAEAQALVARLTGGPAIGGNGQTAPIATDIDCEECGKPMVIRTGRRGRFLGCSGYPKCRSTMEVPARLLEELGLANGDGGRAPAPEPAGSETE
jgi:DNA topoisomerase I